jgi:transposase
MIDDKGVIEGQFKGKKALAALKRYQQWYEMCLQNSFNDAMQRNPTATKEEMDEEIQDMRDREKQLDDQIKDIENNSLSKLEVWIS